MVQAVNCRTVAVVPYAAGIVEWTKEELLIMDRKKHKWVTLYHALHRQADFDGLLFKRSDGKGLMSIEDSVIMRLIVLVGVLRDVTIPC